MEVQASSTQSGDRPAQAREQESSEIARLAESLVEQIFAEAYQDHQRQLVAAGSNGTPKNEIRATPVVAGEF